MAKNHLNHNHHSSHLPPEDMEEESCSGSRFFFGALFTISQLFLFGSITLFIYWVMWHDNGFSWSQNREQQFNLHAVLMIIGFIFLNGQAMLMYKLLHHCKRIYVKILHTIIFVCSISAITIGMMAAIQAQGTGTQQPKHFYSIHSWSGLVVAGLFCLQFFFGFVSFLVLLCCDKLTANYRAKILPTHVTFGLIIFSLASITCISGILQMARARLNGPLKLNYKDFGESTIVINSVGCCIIGLAIIIPYIIKNCGQRKQYSSY